MEDVIDGALAAPPSRQAHRDRRAAGRRAKRRQRIVGVPMGLLGLALIALGTYSYLQNQDSGGPDEVRVGGITQERTTLPPSTTVPAQTSTMPLANLPLPGTDVGSPTVEEAPAADVIVPGSTSTTTIAPPRVVTSTAAPGSTPAPSPSPGR